MRVRKIFITDVVIVMLVCFTLPVLAQTEHFSPCWDESTNPYFPMNIIVVNASYNGQSLQAGDEIGLYSETDTFTCITAKKLDDEISETSPLYIIAPMSENNGCGFAEGDTIVYKVWLNSAQKEISFKSDEIIYYDIETGLPLEHTVLFTALETAAVQIVREPVTCNLSIALSPVNSGLTDPSLGTHSYEYGEVVTVTADPMDGYVFDGWGGDVADPNNPVTTVTMTSDKIVTAYFTEDVVPVELSSFNASYESDEGGVVLQWTTATELNNYGFTIERSVELEELSWSKVGFVEGQGTTSQQHSYRYVDRGHSNTGDYYYRLKQIDMDGTTTYTDALKVGVSHALDYALHQNYPNPFNPETLITFEIAERADVMIELIDIRGRRVAEIARGSFDMGRHEVLFNGRELSSGVYFYRMKTASFEQIKKLMLIK